MRPLLFQITCLGLIASHIHCAGDPHLNTSSSNNSTITAQYERGSELIAAHVTFFHQDFYSLTSPNPSTLCAGDAKTYYNAFLMNNATTLLPLEMSLTATTSTIRPNFIKNISVDQTDTNSTSSSNQAYACSYGSGTYAPPVSSCATFDFGAIHGLPSSLGGAILIDGGLSSVNSNFFSPSCGPIATSATSSSSSGFNTCTTHMHAFGLNVFTSNSAGTSDAPSVTSGTTGFISGWSNLLPSSYQGPGGISGGVGSYEKDLNQILLFSGSSPLAGSNPMGTAVNTYDTWVYDLDTQVWSYQVSNSVVDPSLTRLYDYATTFSPPQTIQLSKATGGRALFGYVSVPGTAIAQLSNNGTVNGGAGVGAGVDTTDRILIVGGLGPCSGGTCTDVHRLNPTFGPEYFDAYPSPLALSTLSTTAVSTTSSNFPLQWIESYPIQLMSNSHAVSNYFPIRPFPVPSSSATPTPLPPTSVNFGMVDIHNHSSTGIYTGAPLLGVDTSATQISGTGYLVTAGGFQGYAGVEGNINLISSTSGACHSLSGCGGMDFLFRWFSGSQYQPAAETQASVFSATTNLLNSIGDEYTPAHWVSLITNNDINAEGTPWFGGGALLKGIHIAGTNTNEVVFFGGSDCKQYLIGPASNCSVGLTSSSWPTIKNPGAYWKFGNTPGSDYQSSTSSSTPLAIQPSPLPAPTVMDTTYLPTQAGMAAARGTDPNGNPLIVSWGGFTSIATPDNSGKIYYLYKQCSGTPTPTCSGAPTWAVTPPSSGASPQGLGNAALVFSHVTGKFYLFGGYNPLTGTNNTTWELTVVTPNCGLTSACQFTWRLLSSEQGLSCYPHCPPARRSHRMVEANYHYVSAPGESQCSSTSPCSFGIFMEGGTADGLSYFADRWMFDPTANGGAGNWQEVGDFPPRTLSALTDADYAPRASDQLLHRAVLFGGETGMQDTTVTQSSSLVPPSFVPPTLGDTWIYDFDTSTWNRVILYGQRFPAASPWTSLYETTARASHLIGDTLSQQFSPPPSAGGIMVTRTLSKPNHLASEIGTKLAIPEVFFFGGRKKDGTYNLFNHVYKFCIGSTGEKPYPMSFSGQLTCQGKNDATCDAFDSSLNPYSLSPSSSYVGKWLTKHPPLTASVNPNSYGAFLGAGAYDSLHDLIVSYGGFSPSSSSIPSTATVTDTATRTTNACGEMGGTQSCIFEYTPPSAVTLTTSSLPSGCPNTLPNPLPAPSPTAIDGSWAKMTACTPDSGTVSLPVSRYGHSVVYDVSHQALVILGGYDSNGQLLTLPGTTSPEVWTATRIDASLPYGDLSKNIPAISTGTFPCYYWSQVTRIADTSLAPNTGLAHMVSQYIPSSGYHSGYYTTSDQACVGAGPIASADPTISKTLVGGAYFDIDRTQLHEKENLILHLTFLPLGTQNQSPNQTLLTSTEAAYFQVHLISTGQTGDVIRQQPQPRELVYASTTQFPKIVETLSILAPPTGVVRQEQLIIPISIHPSIDRIRVERLTGNTILINAALWRTQAP